MTDATHETHVCRDCGAEITLPFVALRELADEMDEADPMRGPGVGEFADKIRQIYAGGFNDGATGNPYSPPSDVGRNLEGYWERAYWRLVPALQAERTELLGELARREDQIARQAASPELAEAFDAVRAERAFVRQLETLASDWEEDEKGHDSDHAIGGCECPCAYHAEALRNVLAP